MKYSYAYHTRSRFADGVCSFAPNLEREAVAFDAPLRDPLRFREAISALHDVVVSDHRFKPRDKSEYEAWKKDAGQRERAIATAARDQARAEGRGRRQEGEGERCAAPQAIGRAGGGAPGRQGSGRWVGRARGCGLQPWA